VAETNTPRETLVDVGAVIQLREPVYGHDTATVERRRPSDRGWWVTLHDYSGLFAVDDNEIAGVDE
jgi:hypothetical protein